MAKEDKQNPILIPASNFADFTECPICMCQIKSATITTCGHRYCETCIHQWVSKENRCPSCNETLKAEQLIKDRQYDSLIEMIGAQGTVGETSSKPNASVEKSTNAKKSVTQHVSPGSCTWPNVAGNQRTLNTQGPVMYNINALAILNAMRNMGNTGMDPGQGLPGQMNPPQMPGQPAPGTTGTLPETGANQMNNRTVIWKGQLEWHDKKSGPIQGGTSCRITGIMGCKVSVKNGDPEINTTNWPRNMIMQLLPRTLLNSDRLHPLFRNSRQVAFHFDRAQPIDSARNLLRVMGNGFAGCVHFPSAPSCDIRGLLLFYSNKRKQFVGLIPQDQKGVVNIIRQVVQYMRQVVVMPQASGTNTGPVQSIPRPYPTQKH